jgi:hypothetical protein
MDSKATPGEKRLIDGQWRVFYEGYWVKAYEVPGDTLLTKKRLIEALTRRLFNHVEHGLNIPSTRLEEARRAFDAETDPQKRRVKGAMLAGALFNRAADVITKVVEIQALGIEIAHDNALMRQCGEHLQEALVLGRMVRHRSGEEGIDELWGEPFKAFAFPIDQFYQSRYLKIAQTMRDIDRLGEELCTTFGRLAPFAGIEPPIRDLVVAAKAKCETLQTDAAIFDVWSCFVAAAERLACFQPAVPETATPAEQLRTAQGLELIRAGKDLISYITRARVPMPKSTQEFIDRCAPYRTLCAPAASHLTPVPRPVGSAAGMAARGARS